MRLQFLKKSLFGVFDFTIVFGKSLLWLKQGSRTKDQTFQPINPRLFRVSAYIELPTACLARTALVFAGLTIAFLLR